MFTLVIYFANRVDIATTRTIGPFYSDFQTELVAINHFAGHPALRSKKGTIKTNEINSVRPVEGITFGPANDCHDAWVIEGYSINQIEDASMFV